MAQPDTRFDLSQTASDDAPDHLDTEQTLAALPTSPVTILAEPQPPPMVTVFASFDTNIAAGRAGEVTDDFQKLTGVAPQPFVAWLAENKAALTG